MDWLSSGVERLLAAMEGQDSREYQSAYDDCLWRIVTSGREALEPFVTRAWLEPIYNLPVPLMVTMCRLYVLASPEQTPSVEQASLFIQAHCSPGEKKGALGDIEAERQRKLNEM